MIYRIDLLNILRKGSRNDSVFQRRTNAELESMKLQLNSRERKLRNLAESVLKKLEQITDEEFMQFDFYPDI